MKNDRQKCKIIFRKFLFNILWRVGVKGDNPMGTDSGYRVKEATQSNQ